MTGKSTLIEALIGHPVNFIGPTNRPIFFTFVNNLSCSVARVTIKRDTSLKGFEKDLQVELDELSSEIQRRNQTSEQPIYISIEQRHTLNYTLIDTPGLGTGKEAEKISLQVARPARRHLICVQSVHEVGHNGVLKYAKRVDPDLLRTTLVHSKLHSHLRAMRSPEEANRFLARAAAHQPSFFTSALPKSIRTTVEEDLPKFQQLLFQAHQRDLLALEALRFDKRHSESVGLFALHQHLQSLVRRSFEESVPSVLNRVREEASEGRTKLEEISSQLNNLQQGTPKLRSLANSYVVEFLQVRNREQKFYKLLFFSHFLVSGDRISSGRHERRKPYPQRTDAGRGEDEVPRRQRVEGRSELPSGGVP